MNDLICLDTLPTLIYDSFSIHDQIVQFVTASDVDSPDELVQFVIAQNKLYKNVLFSGIPSKMFYSTRQNHPRIVQQLMTADVSDGEEQYDSDDSVDDPHFLPDDLSDFEGKCFILTIMIDLYTKKIYSSSISTRY